MSTQYLELSDYLEHHGIKGQKWGVEHGPPYPLKRGVSARIKRAAKSVKNRVEANRKQREARKVDKEERKVTRKETVQDRINKMSDEELRRRTERLKLENAYKRELPQEKEGQSFLKRSANLMNNLKLAGDAFAGLVKTGKEIGKLFGLSEDDASADYNWSKRKPGETAKQYSDRLNALKNIRNKTKEFAKEDAEKFAADEAFRKSEAARQAKEKAEKERQKQEKEYEKQEKKNRKSGSPVVRG